MFELHPVCLVYELNTGCWMFTSKSSMLKVNKIHRRTLRVVYDDYNSTYEELLASHNDISIHQKHL